MLRRGIPRSIVSRARPKRMTRMRAWVYFISGWVTLLMAFFLVYLDWLEKSSEKVQYKIVSRSLTMPDAKRCDHPPTGYPQNTHKWLSAPLYVNASFDILRAIEANRTSKSRCHLTRTRTATVYGLPTAKNGTIELTAGPVHEIRIVSIGPNGENRCAGGDYYETDLIGTFWRSRPPVRDDNDGSYRVTLQVDMRFAGLYVFKIILVFSNFHGLDQPPGSFPVTSSNPWARTKEIGNLKIRFVVPLSTSKEKRTVTCSPELARCTDIDYTWRHWTGRWNREEFNLLCESGSRRSPSKCLKPQARCAQPWCHGPVGLLQSNGWVYSAHCSFKIFTRSEAWSCLNQKWLFWVGDSVQQQTVRNLLTIVLGLEEVDSILDHGNVDHKFIRLNTERNLGGQESTESQSIRYFHQRLDHKSFLGGGTKNESALDSHEAKLHYSASRQHIEGDVRVHSEEDDDFPLQQLNDKLIQSDEQLRIPVEMVPDSVQQGNDDHLQTEFEGKLRTAENPMRIRKPLAHQVKNKFTLARAKRKPNENAQSVRISFVRNDHENKKSFQPLYSPTNTKFLESIKAGFFWGTTPDFIIVDFGLDNAWYYQDATNFVQEGLKLAISFWRKILHELFPRFPLFIYRSASAVAGPTRTTFVNPHKVELYNRIIAEKFEELRDERLPNVRILDAFDLSFPWRFDHNDSSDWLHYSTPRKENESHDENFVNLMLVHILLNTMCEV